MTAFHSMILFSPGAPLTPAGGSSCKRLKSLMSLLLPGVVISTSDDLDSLLDLWFSSKKTLLTYNIFLLFCLLDDTKGVLSQ